MNARLIVGAAMVFSTATVAAAEPMWQGLGEDQYYSGPKIAEKDLLGKVVLVDCWGVNCPPCRALLPRMEQLWQAFKSKPFVLIGSHCQGRRPAEVAALVAQNKLTFPVYERARHVSEPQFRGIPFLYVINHRGKLAYSGNSEREATEALVTAIGNVGLPPDIVPGVSFRRYKPLQKKFKLGNSVKSDVKRLEADVKKFEKMKKLPPAMQQQCQEAKDILSALDAGKAEIREEISALVKSNPAEALKYMQLFMKTFPEEGEAYKDQINELKAAIAEEKKAK